MTVIAYRDGIMACDSQVTVETEGGGARQFNCDKLYKKTVGNDREGEHEILLGTAGDAFGSMVFVDWYGSEGDAPKSLADSEISILIVESDGLYEADGYCRPVKIKDKFYAVGSGAKAALGAMHKGASAVEAVKIACKVCPFCSPPVHSMSL